MKEIFDCAYYKKKVYNLGITRIFRWVYIVQNINLIQQAPCKLAAKLNFRSPYVFSSKLVIL